VVAPRPLELRRGRRRLARRYLVQCPPVFRLLLEKRRRQRG
jgi:hypothetical protein